MGFAFPEQARDRDKTAVGSVKSPLVGTLVPIAIRLRVPFQPLIRFMGTETVLA